MNENALLMVQDFCSICDIAAEHVSISCVLGLAIQQIKMEQWTLAKKSHLNKKANI